MDEGPLRDVDSWIDLKWDVSVSEIETLTRTLPLSAPTPGGATSNGVGRVTPIPTNSESTMTILVTMV